MRKLFLASAAVHMAKFIPDLFGIVPQQAKLAFVPTAANQEENPWWQEADKQQLIDLGYTVKVVDIEGESADSLREKLTGIDVLFVGGGNTYYLLDKAKSSGFIEVARELVEQGVLYVGSSAGSVLAGADIDIARPFDDAGVAPNLTDYAGLGFIDAVICPHYDKKKEKEDTEVLIAEWQESKHPVVLLTDDQAIAVHGNFYQVVNAQS